VETIRTPSRLHFSLIDMEGSLGRVDGGIGVALEEPCWEIGFEEDSEVMGVEGDAKTLAERVCSELGVGGVDVSIKKNIPDHVGFGSKTQLYLALAAGICKVYGVGKSVRELGGMVGRGGTSGIGVAAFEGGGFIMDAGHDAKKGFAPSAFSDAEPPAVVARSEFPWWLVCAWPEGKGAHGEIEKSIFEENCPIPKEEVEKVSRIILMRVLPGVAAGDISLFGEGVNMLQEAGFKRIEVDLKRGEVGELIGFLQENSYGGGMSSFGPVCFGVCENEEEAKKLECSVKESFGFNCITSKANNAGARWP
jgi:beta-ribofuranosylaminobenzene 5'-phosphate synthase